MALENAKNIENSVSRYEDYLSSILKRLSKRRGIFPDLQNALLKVEGCYEPEKIQDILTRNSIRQEDKDFISLLINHRK